MSENIREKKKISVRVTKPERHLNMGHEQRVVEREVGGGGVGVTG